MRGDTEQSDSFIYNLNLEERVPKNHPLRRIRYYANEALKEMSDFFEATVADGADAKLTSNWLMGEVLAYLNKQQKELKDVALSSGNIFEELMDCVKYCSLGQITHALYEVGGQYRRNM